MRVYFPTFYGDMKLKSQDDSDTCVLLTTELTPAEEVLVKKLLGKFGVDVPGVLENKKLDLGVPLAKAHKYLKGVMKKKGPQVTAVTVATDADSKLQLMEVSSIEEAIKSGSEDAVTAPVPKRGCPMPAYDPALERHIRATEVLQRFLRPQQLRDFSREHAFVAFGGHSRDRYLISHRYSRSASRNGIVKNLDQVERVCVEPSILPPAEEMLAVLVALQCREDEWVGQFN